MILLSSADYFQNYFKKKKKSFRKIIRVSNGLGSDQDRCLVSPDLDLNCLQGTKIFQYCTSPANTCTCLQKNKQKGV